VVKLEVLIDGYNLIGWFGLFDFVHKEELTLEEAREEILGKVLANPALGGAQRIKVKLIYDSGGMAIKKLQRGTSQGIKILFVRNTDSFLQRIARKGETVVITRDAPLTAKLREKGVQVCQPEFFFGNHQN